MSQGILLSIDAGLKNSSLQKRMKDLAELTALELHQEIYPVSIVSKKEKVNKLVIKRAQDSLKLFSSQSIHDSIWDSLKLLHSENSSIKARVSSLLKRANSPEVKCIVAGTRELKGTLKGAFVDELVSQSRVPVVVVTPKTKIPEKIKKIVFATDLEFNSKGIFANLCSFAKSAGAEIRIFHALVSESWNLAWGPAFSPSLVTGEMLENLKIGEMRLAHKHAKGLLNLASKYGVKVSLDIRPATYSRSATILAAAQAWNADLLAFGSGGAATVRGHFFGSTPLALMRKAPIPLWMISCKPR